MRIRGFLIPLMVAALGFGCAGQQEADAAFQEAEKAITDQHTQAIRYAPDAFKQVMAVYDSARQSYAAGDYRSAIAGAKATVELTEQLRASVGSGRKAMTEQWNSLHDETGVLLTTLEDRVEALEKRAGRLPAGVAGDDLARARETLPVLKSSFDEANRMFRDGKLSEAVHVASQVRSQATGFTETLGLGAAHGSEP